MIRTPESLIRALQGIPDRPAVPLRKQIQALEELFSLFTTERAQLRRTSYLDIPKYRSAYLGYHLPLNFARCACALSQVRAAFPEVDRLDQVVDLGAGPGSASLATAYTLPAVPARRYALYDRSRGALKIARHLLERCAGAGAVEPGAVSRVHTHATTLPPLPDIPSPALVWMSMLLNELGVDERKGPRSADVVDHVTARIPPGSVLIVVEPAQREAGRRLLAVHDALVASRAWNVLAPCTHDRPCPLVRIRTRPWCHFHFEWHQDEPVRLVSEPLGLSSARSSFAFLAVGRGDPVVPRFRGGARVIGDTMKVRNGAKGVYVCQDGTRKVLSPPPPDTCRGDIVEVGADGARRRWLAWATDRAERTRA